MEDRSGALARRKRRTRRRWRARRGNNARRKKPDSDPVEMMHSVCRSLPCAARAETGDWAGLRRYTCGDDSAGIPTARTQAFMCGSRPAAGPDQLGRDQQGQRRATADRPGPRLLLCYLRI